MKKKNKSGIGKMEEEKTRVVTLSVDCTTLSEHEEGNMFIRNFNADWISNRITAGQNP